MQAEGVEKVPEGATVQKQESRRRQVDHPTIPGLFLPAPKPKRAKRRGQGKLEKRRKEEEMAEEDTTFIKVKN